MKKYITLLLVLIFANVSSAYAYNLGTNITIYDGASNNNNSWYNTHEDQEVEPGCATGQIWDLEGFYIDNTVLNMVGGFDFKNGQDNVQSGDVFIDTDCNINDTINYMVGNGYQRIPNTFGYDYVFDLNFDNTGYTYTLYSLDTNSFLTSVYYKQNEHSNAFTYADGGHFIHSGEFSYTTGLNNEAVAGLLGDSHNVVSLDLATLGFGLDSFIAHFTMGCGNDNLIGTTCNPVPEPATIILLGSGLVAFASIGRKRIKSKLS